jgi:murein DD-endopeptidase MepM/ murein hydrolase activator NlpD
MTSPRSIRHALTAFTLVTAVLALAAPAKGRSVLDGQLAERASIIGTIEQIRDRRAESVAELRSTIGHASRRLRHMPGRGAIANPERFRHLRKELLHQRREAAHRIERSSRFVERRVRALQVRRRTIDAWVATWGVFEHCPIRGWHSISDNFGITVRLPGVPIHRHMGNDILASSGTPIAAPFDGYASASSSELGGLEVRITGSRGYVYNAHLSSYGTLGSVRAGTVVGYVGATGDATTAHDHLEWHPNGGVAVDPYPYLAVSCDAPPAQ